MSGARVSGRLAWWRLRRGWGSLAGPTLLLALTAGLSLAGLAGAVRTRTAVDRSLQDTLAWDVMVNPDAGSYSALDEDEIRRDLAVAQLARWDGVPTLPAGPADMAEFANAPVIMVPEAGEARRRVGRPAVLEGRLPDADVGDELLVNAAWADVHGTQVGDEVAVRLLSAEDVSAISSSFEADEVEALIGDPSFGMPARFRVVGKSRTTDEMLIDEGLEPQAFIAGPGFRARYPEAGGLFWGAFVRLRDPAELDRFMERVRAQVPEELVVFQTMRSLEPRMHRAASTAATILLGFGIAAGSLGLVLVGQAYWRRLLADSGDNTTLATLGMTRGERGLASLLTLVPSVLLGALGALPVAWALSWFAPIGAARSIETRPGFSFDPRLVLGAAAFAGIMLIVVVAAAWRTAVPSSEPRSPGRSASAAWLARAGLPLALVTGVRFALEPAQRDGPLPTRATIVGAATGVAMAMATLVFTAGLDQVVSEPRLYGANFDLSVSIDPGPRASSEPMSLGAEVNQRIVDSALAVAGTSAASVGHLDEVSVDGRPVLGLAFSPSPRPIDFTIAEGRAPMAVDEVALGSTTMRSLGATIGSKVDLQAPGHRGPTTVVGRAVLPAAGRYQGADHTALGEGAVIAAGASGASTGMLFVRVEPGTDRSDYVERLNDALVVFGQPTIRGTPRPADVRSLESLRKVPVTTATVLVGVIAVAVAHALVVAVHRRRRDVAVLRAIGVRAATLRFAGAWQAVTVTLVAASIGVPLGLAAGRWSWMAAASAFGTVPVAVMPWAQVTAFVLMSAVSAAVIGLVCSARGLRAWPAEVLREQG
jgi:hypothetical protein